MITRFGVAAGIVALGLAGPCAAHHSLAMFDMSKTETLQGTVRLFQWTSPHVFIQLLVAAPQGAREWSIQMHSNTAMKRRGWKKDTLVPGDVVTVVINRSLDGSESGLLHSATWPDGRPVAVREVRR